MTMPSDNKKYVTELIVAMILHPVAGTQSLASSFVLYRSTLDCNTPTNSTPTQGEAVRIFSLPRAESLQTTCHSSVCLRLQHALSY